MIDDATLRDPYPFYRELRAEPPVSSPIGYLISRHEDVLNVVQNTQVFSSRLRGDKQTQWGDEPTPAMVEALKDGLPQLDTMVGSDPPDHGRFRRLAMRAFLPARVRQVEDSLQAIADGLVERFVSDERVELVGQFAVPFPLTVIADFLGCDRADVPLLKKWSDDALRPLSGRLTDDERLACTLGRNESQHYMLARIRERQQSRMDDLLSDLVFAEVDGDRLDELEVLSMALGLLVAGNETSRNTIGNGVSLLAQRPDLAERLRDRRDEVPAFVDELLRWEAPVQMLFRVATEDVEIGGTPIPKGSRLAVIWASANRDEERWNNPDEFDIDRDHVGSHLAFGHGEHFCIGHVLAKAELRVGVTTLLDRLHHIRFDGDLEDVERIMSVTFRGFMKLPLTFTEHPAS